MRFLPASDLVGAPSAGFSTRVGGSSTGRYESLNLGERWGDEPGRVQQNRRLLASDAGFDLARLTFARQVHGATCLVVDGRSPGEVAAAEADALLCTEPGRAIGVFTADCLPILLGDGAGRVAVAHAGWRGTVAGVAAAAVRALREAGAAPGALRAVLGPCIGPCCFEVGEEVATEFDRVAPAAVLREAGRKAHVDLRAANATLLEAADVRRVTVVPRCTVCEAESFFSYRRDGAGIGQMLSFVVAGR